MGRGRRLIWALHVQEMSHSVNLFSFFMSLELICMGTRGKRKKVLYPSLLFGKEKFRRDGRRAKKQKGRRAGA